METCADTENGPASNDEINIVEPGFNSGWQTIMGPLSASGNTEDNLLTLKVLIIRSDSDIAGSLQLSLI